jgi:hypothetical protein
MLWRGSQRRATTRAWAVPLRWVSLLVVAGGCTAATTSAGPAITAHELEVVPASLSALHLEPLGCREDLTSTTLDEWFAGRLSPTYGFDNAHVMPISDDRYLWLFNDYISDGTYLHNVGLVQDGTCFQFAHRGSVDEPGVFEGGLTGDSSARFYWPLGGATENGRIQVFWSEMQNHPSSPVVLDGIRRQPIATWLASYDPVTLERLSFERAPDDGVLPQYGSAVVSDGGYSYLFGNSNLLRLGDVGGFDAGPFSGTRTYLARVPRGHLEAVPEYFDGERWSWEAENARPISERFYVSNAMQPRLIDGRWVSITKVDEFWGDRFVVDVAERPEGPWRTVLDQPVPIRAPEGVDPASMVSYHPILLPWTDPDGSIVALFSQNAANWADAVADPRRYRPHAFPIGTLEELFGSSERS